MPRRRPKDHPALFAPPSTPRAAPTDAVRATIDGAARGNPGPAAFGVIFEDAKGKVLARVKGRLGRATNNIAEYRALLAALVFALAQGWPALRVCTDSELLARQIAGDYRVRHAALKPLFAEAQQLIARLEAFSIEAVPRRLTRAADRLANAALDKRPVPSDQRPAKKTPSPAAPAAGRKVVRAIYEGGVLKPLEPLDLRDGEEVELTFRPVKKS